jgi:Na+/proline symporter
MVIIIFGIVYIAFIIGDKAGGVANVVSHAADAGKFKFLPEPTLRDMLWFLGAWVTMMFGSIPQQDVFQRVTSARTEKIAVTGAVLGGSFYFVFAFLPLFMAYAAFIIDPQATQQMLEKDPQHILPNLVINHTPIFAQIMFFGALLAAIMSTAAGTLLAPSVTFTENILKNFLKRELNDRQFLWTMRVVVAVFTVGVTIFALNSNSSIYEMVGSAYKVTLVTAFIPLVCGLYWSRATTQGALFSIFAGLVSWLAMEFLNPEGLMPPQLLGLFASIAGMVIGSLMPQLVGHRHPEPQSHATLHHHAAAQTHHVAEHTHQHPGH